MLLRLALVNVQAERAGATGGRHKEQANKLNWGHHDLAAILLFCSEIYYCVEKYLFELINSKQLKSYGKT